MCFLSNSVSNYQTNQKQNAKSQILMSGSKDQMFASQFSFEFVFEDLILDRKSTLNYNKMQQQYHMHYYQESLARV